jgi:hypothetical protein
MTNIVRSVLLDCIERLKQVIEINGDASEMQ